MRTAFAWTYPIVFSPHDSDTLYVGGNCVFARGNEGMDWRRYQPDLSLNDRSPRALPRGESPRECRRRGHADLCLRVESARIGAGEMLAVDRSLGWLHVTRDAASVEERDPQGDTELAYVGCCRKSRPPPPPARLPTRSTSPPRVTAPTTSPTCSGAATAARAGIDQATCAGRDTRSVVRADPVGQGAYIYIGTRPRFFSLDDGGTGRAWPRLSHRAGVTTSS